MDNLVIRRAVSGDIESLDKLLYQVHKVHSDTRPDLFKAGAKKYTDSELKGILKDDATPVFAATVDSKVIGYAFCIFKEPPAGSNMTDIKTLYIDDLCVDENSRGMHIGKALYDYVLKFARENGCYNVTLNVWAENKSALAFYRNIGLKIQKYGMEKIL